MGRVLIAGAAAGVFLAGACGGGESKESLPSFGVQSPGTQNHERAGELAQRTELLAAKVIDHAFRIDDPDKNRALGYDRNGDGRVVFKRARAATMPDCQPLGNVKVKWRAKDSREVEVDSLCVNRGVTAYDIGSSVMQRVVLKDINTIPAVTVAFAASQEGQRLWNVKVTTPKGLLLDSASPSATHTDLNRTESLVHQLLQS